MSRSDHQWRNLRRRNAMTDEIKALGRKGFKLEWITPYQCRINGVLDLFPTNWRYHNIKTGKRGGFEDVLAIVKAEFV